MPDGRIANDQVGRGEAVCLCLNSTDLCLDNSSELETQDSSKCLQRSRRTLLAIRPTTKVCP